MEDDDSNDDYPIKFIKNPYLMEHSTNLQSILFDRALDKKDEKKQLYEFNNMNILESEKKKMKISIFLLPIINIKISLKKF